jgi:hypothetical protein
MLGRLIAILAATGFVAQGFSASPLPLDVPASATSGMYAMTEGADGKIYLAWIESAAKLSTLKFSKLDTNKWSEPRTIASGDNWFVNWADHPTLTALKDGTLLAHYLVNNTGAAAKYGYHLRMSRSTDSGKTWKEIYHAKEADADYSGFVSLLPEGAGFSAIYLSPGPAAPAGDAGYEGGHLKGLSVAHFGPNAILTSDTVIDPDTCSCCTTSVVQTSDGPIAAYRDHQGEIRDISVVRFRGGKWSEPTTVNADGWKINACPTNGPVLAASGRRVAIAWFTAANDAPHVRLAFSEDAGVSFKATSAVDGGNPVGWPAIVMLDDGSAVVSWLENTGGGNGQVRIRRVWPSGKIGAAVSVAAGPAGRATGVPQMVKNGNSLIVAWRAERVMTISVPIPSK